MLACCALGCGDGPTPVGEIDPVCMQVEAQPGVVFLNGAGYCDGNTHIRCEEGRAYSEGDCAPRSCESFAVPRTVFAGCAAPHPLCTQGQGIHWVCDGAVPVTCWDAFAIDSDVVNIEC